MKQAVQKSLTWAVILSETSHIFCCVFPTVFSLLGLLAGLGIVGTIPGFMVTFHEFMHAWEVPMIVLSGVILAIGWAAVWYGDKIDCCHSTGCSHGTCKPRRNRAHLVLKIATLLFVFNVLIYSFIHKADWFNQGAGRQLGETHHEYDHQ